MQFQVDLDLHLAIRQVRDQFVRIQVSVKDGCAENRFPKELRLEF
jgi:hypothetical protein